MLGCFQVLLLVMLKPRSYTREDVIEIHTHGGGICAQRVLQACFAQGARQAQAGEFTLRAFLNGRLTLAQVTCDKGMVIPDGHETCMLRV
jgi:tRNA modification GTPase